MPYRVRLLHADIHTHLTPTSITPSSSPNPCRPPSYPSRRVDLFVCSQSKIKRYFIHVFHGLFFSLYLSLAGPVAHLLTPNKILVSCSKGILNDTLETVDQILTRIVPSAFASRLAYLSGPSFAAEVAKGLPTLVTVACKVRV